MSGSELVAAMEMVESAWNVVGENLLTEHSHFCDTVVKQTLEASPFEAFRVDADGVPYQEQMVRQVGVLGKDAIFLAGCGMGKTLTAVSVLRVARGVGILVTPTFGLVSDGIVHALLWRSM
jgi:hypothetical protein